MQVIQHRQSTAGSGRIQRQEPYLPQKEIRMAITLIWIAVVFIICQASKLIPDIYEAMYCGSARDKVMFIIDIL